MSDQLLPCPFCGSTELTRCEDYVRCDSCTTYGPDREYPVSSAEAWNTRALAELAVKDAEIVDLQNWKASSMEVEASWDAQAVAKALGLRLGSDIRAGILPGILALQAEKAELVAVLRNYYSKHPQVDNGVCAECRIGRRLHKNEGYTPCSNEDCVSHDVEWALGDRKGMAKIDRCIAEALLLAKHGKGAA